MHKAHTLTGGGLTNGNNSPATTTGNNANNIDDVSSMHNPSTNSNNNNVFSNFVNQFSNNSTTSTNMDNSPGSNATANNAITQQQQAQQQQQPPPPNSATNANRANQFMDNINSVSPVNLPQSSSTSNNNSETTNYWGGGAATNTLLDQANFTNNSASNPKNDNQQTTINTNGGMFMVNGVNQSQVRSSLNQSPSLNNTNNNPSNNTPFTIFNEQSIESLTNSQSPSPHTLPLSHTPPAGGGALNPSGQNNQTPAFLRPLLAQGAGAASKLGGLSNFGTLGSLGNQQNGSRSGSASNSPQRPLSSTSNFLAGRARVTSTNSNISNSSSNNGGNSNNNNNIGQPLNLMAKLQSRTNNATSSFQYNNIHDNFFDNTKNPTPASTPPMNAHSQHQHNNQQQNTHQHHPHQQQQNQYQSPTASSTSQYNTTTSNNNTMTQSMQSPMASSNAVINNNQFTMSRSNSVPNAKVIKPPNSKKPHRFQFHRRDIINGRHPHIHDESRWYSLKIEGNVRNISPVLWKFSHLTRLDMKRNIIRQLPNEVSNLRSLIQLDISHNMIKTLPNSLGNMLELRELNVSHNQIKTLPVSIGKLFNLQSFSIDNNNIDPSFVNCIKRENGIRVLLEHLYEQYINQPSNYTLLFDKPQREWKQLNDNMGMYEVHPISVMTYNILSDKYATQQQYGYCPTWALQWEYRRDKLLEEIQQYSPDIICLQEIEKGVYNRDFKAFLSELNYNGIYSQKGRAKHMYADQQEHVDGCAVFYKNDIFKPVLQHTVEFSRTACKVVDGCDNSETLINRTITKDNIGLLILFEIQSQQNNIHSSPKHVLVANAHLHWDPEFCDIKLVQTIILMNHIHKLRVASTMEPSKLKEVAAEFEKKIKAEGGAAAGSTYNDAEYDAEVLNQLPVKNLVGCRPDSIPVIVAGDFNSLPDSGVLDFVRNGHVYLKHPDWLGFKYPDALRNLELQKTWLQIHAANPVANPNEIREKYKHNLVHDLHFDSAYSDFLEETPFSNFTYEFKGMIDYIFYSQKLLTLTGVLQGVRESWFEDRKIPGAPFIGIPSDHLPLLSEFAFKKPGGNPGGPPSAAPPQQQQQQQRSGSGSFNPSTPSAANPTGTTGNWGSSANSTVPRNTWGNNTTQQSNSTPTTNSKFDFKTGAGSGNPFPW